MRLLLTPTFEQTSKDLGYEDTDSANENDVLYQQGYDISVQEIDPGQEFEISEDFESGEAQMENEAEGMLQLMKSMNLTMPTLNRRTGR